jgi:large subunit ribosomal protein L3
MRELIGRKVGMTRLFNEDGTAVPVTVIAAGPCVVLSRRKGSVDAPESLAVGFGAVRRAGVSKPLTGQFTKAGLQPMRHIMEVAMPPDFNGAPGDTLPVTLFKPGEKVDVSGTSIGKGFQGVMRRHNFGGVGGATHGQSDRLRAPGSIGSSSYPSRVFKGMRMAGRMGGRKTTLKNLEVVQVDAERSLLLLRGAVPGKQGSLLRIIGA